MKCYKELEAQCHTTFVNAAVALIPAPKQGRMKTLSEITILRGDLVIATATLAGEYTASEAYREWIKFLDGDLSEEEENEWMVHGEPGNPMETTTQCGIFLGPVLVAERNLLGYALPDVALENFAIDEKMWKLFEEGYHAARSLQLV